VNRSWLIVVLLAVTASLCAQSQPAQAPPAAAPAPAAQSTPAEEVVTEEPVYLRRISLGVSAGGNPWYLIGGDKIHFATFNPPLDTTVETNPKDHYVFAGALLQFAMLERWAVNVGGLVRTAEFESTQTLLTGTDNPNTIKDERTTTTIKDATKARFLDFPVLLRRYNIGRHEYGHRWFLEAGPSLRYVSKIRTKRDIALPNGTAETESTPTPYKKNVYGITAGAGGQFIDPIGIRVIPEVRYTYWFGETFNSPGLHTRHHQIDILVSFSF
jgi:hypothetical protein